MVSNFYISKYEITQAQWEAIMETTIKQQRSDGNRDYPLRGEGDNYPMYYVSWEEAQWFIKRLNAATGKQYRLPTEAEWEYAARGGNQSRGYKYSGSNNIEELAWYNSNSSSTHPVGAKKANELGIYDMSGNVREWCYDWYNSKYYKKKNQTNPSGASSGSSRVVRGGGWTYGASECTVSFRNGGTPSARYYEIGFRLVLVP
jgi:formylglycine-generating enzyme required for sulfatase activity